MHSTEDQHRDDIYCNMTWWTAARRSRLEDKHLKYLVKYVEQSNGGVSRTPSANDAFHCLRVFNWVI